jgi:DNA-binding LytR/AlgR family response regulator
MKVLKALIAEDEPVLRGELRDTLAKLWPELVICAEAADGIEAIRALDEHAPDIVFLDIQMPGMSGIEVAQQVSGRAHVAFVTAYDKYALAAFEQGAVDYVMKPISPARIATTVARLKQRIKSAPANLDGLLKTLVQASAPKEYLRWITATNGSELQLVTVDEICYVTPNGSRARAVMPTFEADIHKSFAELSDSLDPALFVPANPSTLVNVSAIAGIVRGTDGSLRLRIKQRDEELSLDAAHVSIVAKATGIAADTPDDHRMLATVLFTDIVDSTATASRLGDRAWREVLSRHDGICRQAIERHHGRLIKLTGDGVLATFDGPARAVRCASAIGDSMRGLDLALRAGVHTGECELHQGDVGGIAVHIGARIAALAGPGEVLVSATVRDLVGGSGIEFEDRGMQPLKGIASAIRIFAVAKT